MTNIVLYDGQCGLCDKAVQFLLKIDRRRVLMYAPLQGETAKSVKLDSRLTEILQTIVYVSNFNASEQRVFFKSDAALEILNSIGGYWRLVVPLRMLGRGFRDGVYDWISRNRYRWFGRHESCKLPSSELQSRFLP